MILDMYIYTVFCQGRKNKQKVKKIYGIGEGTPARTLSMALLYTATRG